MLLTRTFRRVRGHCCNVSRQKVKARGGSSVRAQLLNSIETRAVSNFVSRVSRLTTRFYSTIQSEAIGRLELVTIVNDNKIMTNEKKPFCRLPTTVRPYHYEITLVPDLKNFTFAATEEVHIDVKTSTETVVLNCLDIDIKSVTFKNAETGKDLPTQKIEMCVDQETATLTFGEKLPLGKSGCLSFDFVGQINDKMKGFYRSKYTGTDGSVKHAAVTQFESTDARRCFPCWDEPAHKATFDITLNVTSGLTALSNMPVESRKKTDNHEILKFQRTPIMSTYLVAVVVGEFDYVESKTSDGVLVRVYTPKTKKDQGLFALEAATKVLPYYNEYFGISYPLPKMDLIAIADFSAGAMENWGLVTYRETCLLVDPENTSSVQKQWIALVVAHELAHQWFGNLVTMEWWTHLWLNEGYASFMEFLCVDLLFPEYDIWTQFVTDTHIRALELDGLKNSHPIEVPVGHPSEIDEIFDDISYNKGASVIRMLHAYIGPEDFRKGMALYLKQHSWSNTETEDLWVALEKASNKPIREVMSTWTKQTGFPLISVDQRQEGSNRIVTLTQERFLSDGSVDTNSSLWMIPITVSTARNPTQTAISSIMSEKTKEITITNVAEGDWIKLNPGTIGFYRTRYRPEALTLLIPAIKARTIPPLDRLGLLDDLSAMVQAGHASTVEVLRLAEAFQHEDNYTVWASIANSLGKIGVLVGHLEFEDTFKSFGRSLFSDVSKRLGWTPKSNESHLDTLLRSLVLGRMAAYGDKDVITEARKRFDLHVTGKTQLSADLRSAVYRAVLSTNDPEIYETMLKIYRETDLHEEKHRILRAFGSIRDEKLLSKALEFAMSDEVRAQDTVFAIIAVAMSYKGRVLAWEFYKKHWKSLCERYDSGALMTRLVKNTTENFVTYKDAKDVEEFFKEHPTPGSERTVQQSIETIKLNAAWLERDQASIQEYLKSYKN